MRSGTETVLQHSGYVHFHLKEFILITPKDDSHPSHLMMEITLSFSLITVTFHFIFLLDTPYLSYLEEKKKKRLPISFVTTKLCLLKIRIFHGMNFPCFIFQKESLVIRSILFLLKPHLSLKRIIFYCHNDR